MPLLQAAGVGAVAAGVKAVAASVRSEVEGAPAGASGRIAGPAGALVGGHRLRGLFLLAPVAGYSDAAFRSVAFAHGAAICYTEMVSSEALVRGHPKTRLLLERAENETEFSIQLFGASPTVLARAAAMAAEWKPAYLDLNSGCPVPKIVRNGAGSALMKTPEKIGQAISAMRDASGLPVTVKFRLGWDDASINYREVAEIAVRAGAAAICLHARTRAQQYSGQADWAAIAELARDMPIPVFGSGDVFGAEAAARMLRDTGCAGVMIARGAMGNPFVFEQAEALLRGESAPLPGPADIAAAARRHLELAVRFLGEKTASAEFRKQLCAYTKGMPHGAPLRARAVQCSNQAEFEVLLREMESIQA